MTDAHAGTGGSVEGTWTSTCSRCRRRTSRPTGRRRRRSGRSPRSMGRSAIASFAATISAVAEFESRAHRDEVMEKVMQDPRVTEMLEGEQIAHMSKMRYGGFHAFVNP
jgi:hypothetical protein